MLTSSTGLRRLLPSLKHLEALVDSTYEGVEQLSGIMIPLLKAWRWILDPPTDNITSLHREALA